MFSDPAVGDNFFGRQSVVDLLVKRANALKSGYRQNVAIIGHQEIGKTSILRQFLHLFRDPDILCIYVEIKFQALDYFIDRFVRSLLFQYLSRREPVDPAEPLAALSQRATGLVPKTVQRINDILALLKQRHAEEAYTKLFELTSSIKQETGKNCIVIFDEFHRLGELGIKNAFTDFGKRIMVQKDTMYLLSSSSFSVSRKILAEKLALLFGNFERIYLEPFDFDTSLEFIRNKVAPVQVSDPLKTFLIAFTDGHPFFLGVIAARLKELALVQLGNELTRETVAEVLLKLLYESQGILHQYFLKLISPWTRPNAHGCQLLLLTELAKGKNKLKELSVAANRNQKETGRQIRELMEHELVIKTGVFYRFPNKIFKFWLREVYEKKELSLLTAGDGADDFVFKISQLIGEHEELTRDDLADRVLKLFGLFNNEMIEFGEKKRKLPHFTEFLTMGGTAAPSEGRGRSIIAKGYGRCWICKIVEEKATEKEVLDLVAGGSRVKELSPTKVLVALRGLEESAKLLAKEKRVLTLGLSRINLLMDVYGKSPIVC